MASVQILDGGLGTSLQDKYGVVFDESTPLWASHLLVADPATLLACQRDFAAAGIDVLLTATYQVSVEGFGRTKTADFPNGIPRRAIGPYLKTALDVAEQAVSTASVNDGIKIALSLGPYGATMIPGQEYSGNYDIPHDNEDALYRWHLDRLQLFAEADEQLFDRVKYIAFETLPRLDEIRAVRKAIYAMGLAHTPFWVSCVFPNESEALPDGSSIEQIVTAAISPLKDGATPWGIGINCTKASKLAGLVSRFGESVAKMALTDQIQTVPTLVLYPDGTNGEVYNTLTQKWEKQKTFGKVQHSDTVGATPLSPWDIQLAKVVHDARTKGPFQSYLVGGCCKATHEDIQKLCKQLENSG